MGRKKQKKRLKKLMRALRDGGGASPTGESTMNSDPFSPEPNADPSSGTAAIPPVTDAMMDHAAHRAAELVVDAAHGAVVAREAPDLAAEAVPERLEAAPVAVASPEAASRITEAAVADLTDVPHGTTEAVSGRDGSSGGEVEAAARDASTRVARAPQAAPSNSADALGLYNTKLFEAMRANMAATGSHVAALLQARSVPEAAALHADHLCRQLDTLTAQGRELATLAQKLTLDALVPMRGLIAPDR